MPSKRYAFFNAADADAAASLPGLRLIASSNGYSFGNLYNSLCQMQDAAGSISDVDRSTDHIDDELAGQVVPVEQKIKLPAKIRSLREATPL